MLQEDISGKVGAKDFIFKSFGTCEVRMIGIAAGGYEPKGGGGGNSYSTF
jgi:hypothetical protein